MRKFNLLAVMLIAILAFSGCGNGASSLSLTDFKHDGSYTYKDLKFDMSLKEVEKAVGELELLSDVSTSDIDIYEKPDNVTFKKLNGKVKYEFKDETLDSVIFEFETQDDFSEYEKIHADVVAEFIKAYGEPDDIQEKEKGTVPIINTETITSSAMWKDGVSTLQAVLLSSKDKSILFIGVTEFKS